MPFSTDIAIGDLVFQFHLDYDVLEGYRYFNSTLLTTKYLRENLSHQLVSKCTVERIDEDSELSVDIFLREKGGNIELINDQLIPSSQSFEDLVTSLEDQDNLNIVIRGSLQSNALHYERAYPAH